MEIYDFLNLFTDLSSVRIRIFDLRIEDIVFDSRNHPDAPDMVQEIAHSGFDIAGTTRTRRIWSRRSRTPASI